jgi:hypothetical protein
MTKQIRKSVFETNSSSSHSLTMSPGDIVAQPFSDAVLRSGLLQVGVGEFGWTYERFYTAENKIRYLLTQITRGEVPESDDIAGSLRESYSSFNLLCDVVKAHTGVDIEVLPSSGYIDHESVGVGMELFQDEEKLKQFLFSADSYVETGNDNEEPPALMYTDRGSPEPTYGEHYATPASDAIATQFTLSRWPENLKSLNGELIDFESPVMQQMREKGVVVKVQWTDSSRYGPFDYADPLAYTMSLLARLDFKFNGELDVAVTQLPKPKNPQDGETTATLTFMLPQELATRFVETH